MEIKIEQWMRDAAASIMQLVRDYEVDGRRIGHPATNGLVPIIHIIASYAPNPSPDICEKCGQEVVDGHFSLICHKPTCIAALQEFATVED